MAVYLYQRKEWPYFTWNQEKLATLLATIHHGQGRLLGRMEGIGLALQEEAALQTLTQDVLKSSEIEGEILNPDQVRSSIALRLGIDIAGLVASDRNVDGVVEMMLDATQKYADPLSEERLFGWHAALFPMGRSGISKIVVGNWRNNRKDDPMQVVSGPTGREQIHYQAPDAELVADEMNAFIYWFNTENTIDPILKSAIAHLWFVTIHPFDDGNGRVARAISDLQLARSEGTAQRFYSMSAQIRKERNGYYAILEQTQKESLDITDWLQWFLNCINRALLATEETLATVIKKAKFWEKQTGQSLNHRQIILINKLLDGFEGKLNTSKWAKLAKCSTDTALRDITDLVEKNILVKEAAGGRSTSYIVNL